MRTPPVLLRRPLATRTNAVIAGLALAGAHALAAPGIAGAHTDDHCTEVDDIVECIWDTPGETFEHQLPDNAIDITITAIGGAGGDGGARDQFGTPTPGGNGAQVSHTSASPDDLPAHILTVTVGENGDDGESTSPAPGGDGGNASAVTTNSGTHTLVFAAGGGGGGGPREVVGDGGQGGSGDSFVDDTSDAMPSEDDIELIGIGGNRGAGGAGGIGGGSEINFGGPGSVGEPGENNGGHGGTSGGGGAGLPDGIDGGDGGAGGHGFGGHGGMGGNGINGNPNGGQPGLPGGTGGLGLGAEGGDGGSSIGSHGQFGGDGGTGGLSFILGESELVDGRYPIVGAPAADDAQPSVTLTYRLDDDGDNGNGDDPGTVPDITPGSLAVGSLIGLAALGSSLL